MCKCKSLPDRLEDQIEKAVLDSDWATSEFLQDILEVCLVHRNDVAETALRQLMDTIPCRETYGPSTIQPVLQELSKVAYCSN